MKAHFFGSQTHPPFALASACAVLRTAEQAPEGVHVESWHDSTQSPTRNPLYPGETLELKPEFSR